MHAVEWQRETPPRPPLLLLTAADHQYHKKAEKPRLAYRWCQLSIVFIAAVSTATGGSFDLLRHRLCRVLGIHTRTCRCCLGFSIPQGLPAPCLWPPTTRGQLRISSASKYRQMLTSLRAHVLISWGPRNQCMIQLRNKPRMCTIMWQYPFKCYMYKHCVLSWMWTLLFL